MSRQNDIEMEIEIHNRRLQILRQQQATFGLQTPPHILIEIEDIETKIERLNREREILREIERAERELRELTGRYGYVRLYQLAKDRRGIIAFVVLALLGIGAILIYIGGGLSPKSSLSVTPTAILPARVVRIDSEIQIDGLLDESAWSEGDSLTYARHPAENGSTTAAVRFLWDDNYLYAGFDIYDTQVEKADPSAPWDSDSVSVLLHDRGIAEYRQSLGESLIDDFAILPKDSTTPNDPSDTDIGYTVEMRIKWRDLPLPGKRIPADLLSVDHDANPGAKSDAPGTIFSKLTWDGDGNITTAEASLLLVEGKH